MRRFATKQPKEKESSQREKNLHISRAVFLRKACGMCVKLSERVYTGLELTFKDKGIQHKRNKSDFRGYFVGFWAINS